MNRVEKSYNRRVYTASFMSNVYMCALGVSDAFCIYTSGNGHLMAHLKRHGFMCYYTIVTLHYQHLYFARYAQEVSKWGYGIPIQR
jgi:hypothetical protein